MIVTACISVIVGMIIGRFFREPDNNCPRIELGYNCMGSWCDHRQSELYRAKMHMALNRERAEREPNFWKGDSNEQ